MSSTRPLGSATVPTDRPTDLRDTVADDAPGSSLSRRRVLGLGAGMSAVGLLAACGGGDNTTASPGDGSEPADGTATESGGGATENTGGDAGPLVATAEVPVEGGVILEDKKVVVTQPRRRAASRRSPPSAPTRPAPSPR